MFLRPTYVKRNGQRVAYWRLVESYRTARGPRQRTVAYLGQIDEAGRVGVEQAAEPKPESRQRRLFAEYAPEGIGLDDLATLGPIFILKLRLKPEELGRRLVAEMWLYPDGSRILELSTRCATTEAFQVAAETRAFLADQGVDLSGEQETKTHKALEYFAGVAREAKG